MQDFITIIGILSPICAIVFGYATFTRNKKSDTTADAKQDATVLTEIGYIKGGIDDIKPEQREQRKTNTDFISRLTAVEQSAKQAHKRIDRLENITDHTDHPDE
ncbi:hypothetical protein JQM63_09145 [Oscillibacter valericigenes]|nr:hypothetical protein [Oscillibacter valericigenes]